MTLEEYWDWSLTRYGCHSTRELLLNLQETTGLVIMEALFAAWMGDRGFRWKRSAVEQISIATSAWIEEVVLPLRATRKRWKPDHGLRAQSEQLQQLEVEAERHLAQLMWEAVMNAPHDAAAISHEPEHGVSSLMEVNLALLPVFYDGKNVSQRKQLVALLSQPT
jgi:uncharacterized protein (TIGR02444 family)